VQGSSASTALGLPFSFSRAVVCYASSLLGREGGGPAPLRYTVHNSILLGKFGPVHFRATAYGPRLQTAEHTVNDIFVNENEHKNDDYFENKNYTAHCKSFIGVARILSAGVHFFCQKLTTFLVVAV